MNFLKNINAFILKYISFIIIAFSITAFFIPDNFSWMTKHTAFFLGAAMFGMGMTIKAEDFKIFISAKIYCNRMYHSIYSNAFISLDNCTYI